MTASVKHLSKDHVRIEPGPGWSVVIFNCGSFNVEAVVTADDGSETIRLRVEPPKPGRYMNIKVLPEGGVDLIYGARIDGH